MELIEYGAITLLEQRCRPWPMIQDSKQREGCTNERQHHALATARLSRGISLGRLARHLFCINLKTFRGKRDRLDRRQAFCILRV